MTISTSPSVHDSMATTLSASPGVEMSIGSTGNSRSVTGPLNQPDHGQVSLSGADKGLGIVIVAAWRWDHHR